MYRLTEERIANDLRCRIESELDRVGLLFRAFSRSKSEESLDKKIRNNPGKYAENGKKIQDLYGIRVALYFPDDSQLAQKAIKNIFDYDEESSTIDVHDSNIFSATRCNLIFKLPIDLISESGVLEERRYIDKTFEVQLRTVLSEGWHEVEHDLRYKCKEDWVRHDDLSRALNGIYASLETADWSMMMLFDELSHRHYKAREWTQMIRTKFRVRADAGLSQQIINVINIDRDLAKRIYRINRNEFLLWVLNSRLNLPITLNNIIFMCNHYTLRNEFITEITPTPVKDMLSEIQLKGSDEPPPI